MGLSVAKARQKYILQRAWFDDDCSSAEQISSKKSRCKSAMIESDIASDSKTDINRPSPQSSALEVEVLNKLMQESKSVLLGKKV